MLGLGLSLWRRSGLGINPNSILYAAAWAAAVTAAGGTYSGATYTAIQALDVDLGLASLKGKLIYFNPRCGSNIIAASVPLIAKAGPGLDTRTGSFAAWNEGLGLKGTTGVANTGVSAQAAGATVSAACLGVYMLDNAAAANSPVYGLQGGAAPDFGLYAGVFSNYILFDTFSSNANGRTQTNNSLLWTGALTKGLICGSRYGANSGQVSRNGVVQGVNITGGDSSSGTPSTDTKFYTNIGSSGSDFIGLNFTPDDVANMTWILQTFNAGLQRSVTADGMNGITIVPDPFTFTAVTNATQSTLYVSNTITPTGYTNPSPLNVSGGEYSIAGGAYDSAPTTITPGQTVAVRQTTSADEFAETDVTLTIGGVSGVYAVTTTGVFPPIEWSTSNNGFGVITQGFVRPTATRANDSGFWRSARSETAAAPGGKRYVEVLINEVGGGGLMIGLGNGSESVENFIGIDNNGVAYWNNFATILKNNTTTGVAIPGSMANGATIGILWDDTGKTIQFNLNGGSFTSTVDVTSIGSTVYIMASLTAGPFSRVRLQNPLVYSIPSGATKWDGT